MKIEPSVDPLRRRVFAEDRAPELVAVTVRQEPHVGCDGLLRAVEVDLPLGI